MFEFSLERWLTKPVSTDCASAQKHLSLRCARNGFAAFHVYVSGGAFALNVGKQPYFSQTVALPVIRIAVDCALGSSMSIEQFHTDDGGINRADALLSVQTAEYNSSLGAVFVRINAPKNCDAGEYSGKITAYLSNLFGTEKVIEELTFTLTVSEFTLPDAKDFTFHLDLWQHLTGISRVSEQPLWSDGHFEAIEKYAATLGYLGQKAVTLVVSEVPWIGQLCCKQSAKANLYEYSIIPVTKTTDGFRYDYTKMQRYIDICEKNGICGEITLIGLLGVWVNQELGFGSPVPDHPDAVRIRYYDEQSGCYAYMDNSSDIDDYVASLERYFVSNGLIDKVRLCADEPADVEKFAKCCEHMRAVAPRFKMKSAINHSEFIRRFGDVITDFVPFIDCVAAEHEAIDEFRVSMPDSRFMWYVCCSPRHPNNFLASPLRETLFFGLLTSYLNLHGFLRWSYTVYNDDPRNDIRYPAFPAGDLYLVYPSKGGDVLLSLRYTAMRRSVEMFEMFGLLKAKGRDATELYDMILRDKSIEQFGSGKLEREEYMSCNDEDYDRLYEKMLDMLSE